MMNYIRDLYILSCTKNEYCILTLFLFFCSRNCYFPILDSSQRYAFKCISIYFDLIVYSCFYCTDKTFFVNI